MVIQINRAVTPSPQVLRRALERFRAKWEPVGVKKTRQFKNREPGFESIKAGKALGGAISFVVLAAASPAVAQNRPIEIPAVVVSSDQVPLESDRVGASVTVLAGRELREKNMQTLADALRAVPGVEIDSSGGRGSFTAVRIRGGESRHTMVLIDGIEVNQLGFPGFDFADLTLDDVERIEVLRGPQSGVYGANALAGVISIVTVSGKALKKPSAAVRVEGGSQDTKTGSASVRGANGPFYGAISGTGYTSKGYNVSRTGDERDGSHAMVGSAKLGVDVTPDFNIEGVVRHTDRSVDTDAQSFLTGLLVDADNRNDYNSTAARIGATFSLFDGHWVQSLNGKYFEEHSRGISGTAITSGADGQRANFETKSVFSFGSDLIGGEKHTAIVLYDHRNEHFRQIGGMTSYDKFRDSLAGEYILDLPSATTLSGALRQDWNSAFANVVTWRGAISQRIPVTMSRLHASVGKGVTDPDVFQLFGSSFNLANPGLVPEQSVGWDVGLEQKFWNARIVTDVTYFSTNFDNKIELNAIPGGGFIYRNGVGSATRRGLEVSQTIGWTEWLSTTAIYTYTDALDSAGLREVRRPLHSGAFEVTATTPDKRTRASARVTVNGERTDLFFGFGGPPRVTLPSYTLVRGTISHDVTPWSTVYVRAENIFNKQYEEIFSFRAPGFTIFAGLKVHTID